MATDCQSLLELTMEGLCQPPQEVRSEVTNQSTLEKGKKVDIKKNLVKVLFHYGHVLYTELLDLQWKMGMAVSSDSCKSLKSPYVAVTLKVADQSGQITNKSFEMTIPQFQYFFKQFKEMAAVIETV